MKLKRQPAAIVVRVRSRNRNYSSGAVNKENEDRFDNGTSWTARVNYNCSSCFDVLLTYNPYTREEDALIRVCCAHADYANRASTVQ